MRAILSLSLSAILGCAACVGGCASPPQQPVTEESRYTGPPVSIKEAAGEHVVVLTAPTAGWSFSLDEVRRRLGGHDVFVTVRRPNPAYLHAQAQVEQNLGTEISVSEDVDVYARVLDHDASGAVLVYYLAASAP